MLYIVLILVIAAFGLLIASLVTKVTFLAWASLGVSVLAAIGLIVDWVLRRRAARRETVAEQPETADAGEGQALAGADPGLRHGEDSETAVVAAGAPDAAAAPAGVDRDEEPGEEETDAADLLLVSESDAEIRVVDEHPRYHLAGCPWLGSRATLPLPVGEARELGFTACAACEPDAEIAAAEREHSATGHSS